MNRVRHLLRLRVVAQGSEPDCRNQQHVRLAAVRERDLNQHLTRLLQSQHLHRLVVHATMSGISTNTVSCRFRRGQCVAEGVHRPARHLVAPNPQPSNLPDLPQLRKRLRSTHHHRRAVKCIAPFLLGRPPALLIRSRNRLSQLLLPHHLSKPMSPHVRQDSSLPSVRRQPARRRPRLYRRRRIRLFLLRYARQILHPETE